MEDQDNRRFNPAQPSPIHPIVAPFSYLLGAWRGQGEGGFPTRSPFLYGEELDFYHCGTKIWKLESGNTMHLENGFWRLKPDGTMDIVIGQSTGIAEIQTQKWRYNVNEQKITLQSDPVENASKGKEIIREFEMVDGKLSSVHMSPISIRLQLHLKALLHKL